MIVVTVVESCATCVVGVAVGSVVFYACVVMLFTMCILVFVTTFRVVVDVYHGFIGCWCVVYVRHCVYMCVCAVVVVVLIYECVVRCS